MKLRCHRSIRWPDHKMSKTCMEYLYGERIYGCKLCAAYFSIIESMIPKVSASLYELCAYERRN